MSCLECLEVCTADLLCCCCVLWAFVDGTEVVLWVVCWGGGALLGALLAEVCVCALAAFPANPIDQFFASTALAPHAPDVVYC